MNILVAYYSLGGNTETVAKKIAHTLHADIVEIHTAKVYQDDHDVLLSLGKIEVESGYMPLLQPLDIDFGKYDAVILGSPVWWGSFAPAMKKFLASYKWNDKIVFPFVTSGGKIGHVQTDFRKALRGASVAPVLNVKFEEKTKVTPDSKIDEWIKKVNNELGQTGKEN